MFGHGQLEGFAEKYGMEFRRAAWGEQPDEGLVAAHERMLAPLLHRRGDFAEVARLPAVRRRRATTARVREDVFAYSNGRGSAARWSSTTTGSPRRGLDPRVVAVRGEGADGSKQQVRRTLAEGLGAARRRPRCGCAIRDARAGLEYLRSVGEVRDRGLHVELRAYETLVFGEFRELADPAGIWARLAGAARWRGRRAVAGRGAAGAVARRRSTPHSGPWSRTPPWMRWSAKDDRRRR